MYYFYRFPGAENHAFILEFFTYIGDHYLGEKRPKEFIFHLLNINIPGLFCIEPGKEISHVAQSIPVSFKTILREYIQRNRLNSAVVGHVTAIWVSAVIHTCTCTCIQYMYIYCTDLGIFCLGINSHEITIFCYSFCEILGNFVMKQHVHVIYNFLPN